MTTKTTKTEKPAVKKAAAKPAAKAAAKPAAKTTAKPAAKKTAPKKPKVVETSEICAKLRKLASAAKAKSVKENIAVDVEIWGYENDGKSHLYIEIKNGAVDIQPYQYSDCTVEAYISYDNILKIAGGTLTVKDAVLKGALNANGNIPAAILIGSIF